MWLRCIVSSRTCRITPHQSLSTMFALFYWSCQHLLITLLGENYWISFPYSILRNYNTMCSYIVDYFIIINGSSYQTIQGGYLWLFWNMYLTTTNVWWQIFTRLFVIYNEITLKCIHVYLSITFFSNTHPDKL